MTKDLIQIKYREEIVGIRIRKIKYTAEVTHTGLHDYKVFTSEDEYMLKHKVNSHVANLKEKWDRLVQKENTVRSKEEIQKEADFLTQEAIKALKKIDNLLLYTLDLNAKVDWAKLKDYSKYSIQSPEKELDKLLSDVIKPKKPVLDSHTQKPEIKNYQPNFTFFDNLFKSRKEAKIQTAILLYEKALKDWNISCENIDLHNQILNGNFQDSLVKYEKAIEIVRKKNILDTKKWEKDKAEFIVNQTQSNSNIDILKEKYLQLDPNTIILYSDLVLNNSQYPEDFPKSYELDYIPETKILIVEYYLPSIDQLPTLNEVKVIKNELKEYHISETQTLKMFDAAMYNITLRTIHELLEADTVNAIEAVSFNGWVNTINKATGKRKNSCILSIQVKKLEFKEIDIRHVEPKTCFKNFKGVGSSKLSGITAIQPILQISRMDKRFVNHYDVADSIDNSTNLASMDWQDFEHLIREIFGKEFSSNGGEVKVTQASRDGGVDAIAFDPDPIRGGKIVIQAKRYTNTVGVSAVRDLYGTVMNEGATKGILVTTTDYGSDAYEFAKGKPLTLMNGSHLLYLLEKHGHHARIDIREARETLR